MRPLPFCALILPLSAALNPDTLLDGFKRAVDCDSCHALLVPLKGLAELGDGTFVKTLVATCKILHLEDDDVCTGAISEQGPILAHALRSISPFGKTATKLCEGTFGLCQTPTVNEYTVPLPDRATRVAARPSGKKPFQVVHFSDVHIDRQYVTDADADCNKPICCRNFPENLGPPKEPAGPFGNRNCDSPVVLAKSLLKKISAMHAWSIFTGDVVEAAVWQINKTEVTGDMNSFNHALESVLGSPVFPAIGKLNKPLGMAETYDKSLTGNHDAAPANNFPLSSSSKYNAQWVFDLVGKEWAHWTDISAAREVKHFSGSYSVEVPGTNLRIISINTVYWYKQKYASTSQEIYQLTSRSFWLYASETPPYDPHEILAFLVEELREADKAGKRVWIIGHMPPGNQDTFSDQASASFSNYYDQVIKHYYGIIAGQFFGHTHYDEFQVAYSNYADQNVETAISVAWIGPALTPRSGNPAFKVYDVDPETYEIMDAKVYIADMANPNYQVEPEWGLYYSAREEYGQLLNALDSSTPLDAKFWHAVTEAFEKNDTAFQRYNEFKTRGAHIQPCNDTVCKKTAICGMRGARAEDNCHVVTPTTTFGDTERQDVSSQQCEGAGIGHLLRLLPNRLGNFSVGGIPS
ncbi:Sphingomyelin phosphodiesterase [Mycena indigotica]|uniref:Sphingomyelin phosphodiesterase n=1 Tax=Mycena indigotica TaxID=2126181 RepID=A0A8H6TEX7_9AGAR|nr:Sphingomyelin phosphodiesterase [Mycena indigotica]KAF7316260.1 Sphingomyelin phosphodiesterase [Mycena indigotica]